MLLSADALGSVLPFLFEEGGNSVPVCAPALSARPLPDTKDRRLGRSPRNLADLHLRYKASGSGHENGSLPVA